MLEVYAPSLGNCEPPNVKMGMRRLRDSVFGAAFFSVQPVKIPSLVDKQALKSDIEMIRTCRTNKEREYEEF